MSIVISWNNILEAGLVGMRQAEKGEITDNSPRQTSTAVFGEKSWGWSARLSCNSYIKNARHCTVFSVSLHCFNALARPLSLQPKFKVSIEEKE
jgi:hypothetical protein